MEIKVYTTTQGDYLVRCATSLPRAFDETGSPISITAVSLPSADAPSIIWASDLPAQLRSTLKEVYGDYTLLPEAQDFGFTNAFPTPPSRAKRVFGLYDYGTVRAVNRLLKDKGLKIKYKGRRQDDQAELTLEVLS